VPELHLFVALKSFGAEGYLSSPKRLHDNFGLSKGSILDYVDQCAVAIFSLCNQCFIGHLLKRD
jgi:hypothetical protein